MSWIATLGDQQWNNFSQTGEDGVIGGALNTGLSKLYRQSCMLYNMCVNIDTKLHKEPPKAKC